MQAVVIEKFGDPSGMAVVELPMPAPGFGQVLIRVEAIGVGGVDAVIRRGTLGSLYQSGMIPGSEVAGTVTAVGDDVDSSWVGRRVWAFTGTEGGYAEYALALVVELVAIPDALASDAAVTIGSAATVAHFALAHAHLAAGESVLVRGAAGSIGIAAVEIARRSGASSIAVTTSSTERGLQLRRLGASEILDRSGSGSPSTLSRFDVIIDIVGGEHMPAFIDRLAPNGRMILVGAVAGFPPEDFGQHLMQAFQQSKSFATFSLASIPTEARDIVRAQVFESAVRGELHPVIHETMPLDQAAQAHHHMDLGTVFGRIVLSP